MEGLLFFGEALERRLRLGRKELLFAERDRPFTQPVQVGGVVARLVELDQVARVLQLLRVIQYVSDHLLLLFVPI